MPIVYKVCSRTKAGLFSALVGNRDYEQTGNIGQDIRQFRTRYSFSRPTRRALAFRTMHDAKDFVEIHNKDLPRDCPLHIYRARCSKALVCVPPCPTRDHIKAFLAAGGKSNNSWEPQEGSLFGWRGGVVFCSDLVLLEEV